MAACKWQNRAPPLDGSLRFKFSHRHLAEIKVILQESRGLAAGCAAANSDRAGRSKETR